MYTHTLLASVAFVSFASALPSLPEPLFKSDMDLETVKERVAEYVPVDRARQIAQRKRATRVARASPSPSPVPDGSSPRFGSGFNCGALRVIADAGELSGYVSADLDNVGRYIVTQNTADALFVSYGDNTLTITNGDGTYPTVGGTFGVYFDTPPGESDMAPNAQNYAYINSVDFTPYGLPATMAGCTFNDYNGRDRPSESSIFYLDPVTGELTVQWVNGDQSFASALWAVNPLRQVVISGEPARYLEYYGGSAARLYCQNVLEPQD